MLLASKHTSYLCGILEGCWKGSFGLLFSNYLLSYLYRYSLSLYVSISWSNSVYLFVVLVVNFHLLTKLKLHAKLTRERFNVQSNRAEWSGHLEWPALTAPFPLLVIPILALLLCIYSTRRRCRRRLRRRSRRRRRLRLNNALARPNFYARITASFLLLSNPAKLLNELAVCFFHSSSLL